MGDRVLVPVCRREHARINGARFRVMNEAAARDPDGFWLEQATPRLGQGPELSVTAAVMGKPALGIIDGVLVAGIVRWVSVAFGSIAVLA